MRHEEATDYPPESPEDAAQAARYAEIRREDELREQAMIAEWRQAHEPASLVMSDDAVLDVFAEAERYEQALDWFYDFNEGHQEDAA